MDSRSMKLLFADTETTGLIEYSLRSLEKQPEVTQYYGLLTDVDGLELSDLQVWCKPKKPVPAKLEKKIGITNEFLSDKEPFLENALAIKNQLESADKLICHNAAFDSRILKFEFERLGIQIKLPELVCTVELCEPIFGYRIKLEDLHHKFFGVKIEGAHNARNDVVALKNCYFELKKRGLI